MIGDDFWGNPTMVYDYLGILTTSLAQPGPMIHIVTSFIALCLLIIASTQALFIALKHYLLRHPKHFLRQDIFPPLQSMEKGLFTSVVIGMLIFSISLISGFIYGHKLSLLWQPKTLLALSAWLILGGLLIGRRYFGWRGPTAIRWTVIGTLFAFLSYFGTKAILP